MRDLYRIFILNILDIYLFKKIYINISLYEHKRFISLDFMSLNNTRLSTNLKQHKFNARFKQDLKNI
jgi:hypothetical protein